MRRSSETFCRMPRCRSAVLTKEATHEDVHSGGGCWRARPDRRGSGAGRGGREGTRRGGDPQASSRRLPRGESADASAERQRDRENPPQLLIVQPFRRRPDSGAATRRRPVFHLFVHTFGSANGRGSLSGGSMPKILSVIEIIA